MTRPVRCAVYTRKSSDAGLEQSFNSLHAQREACEAYILSQKHEGWVLVPHAFDDGGFSGGSMERPALKALLAAVRDGAVDIIVVYKVDRLTRSLADFAKMVELFDGKGASFVSVTPAFNTTTSMGRLTLNVLLSFAQFEREVTGERIRDKIAASKVKGLWMGGVPPLGYDPDGRTLKVNEAEAVTVRHLFERYLALGSVDEVVKEATASGIRSKSWTTQAGRRSGGGKLSRDSLYRILASPIYRGEMPHGDKVYPGQHPAIVPAELFKEVFAMLAAHRRRKQLGERAAEPSLLGGLVVDARGNRLTATHSSKGARRYRYYAHAKATAGEGMRVPAADLETLVTTELARVLTSPELIAGRLAPERPGLADRLDRAASAGRTLEGAACANHRALMLDLIDTVTIDEGEVRITLATSFFGGPLLDEPVVIAVATVLGRRKTRLELVVSGAPARNADPALVALVAQARGWFEALASGAEPSAMSLARREGLSSS